MKQENDTVVKVNMDNKAVVPEITNTLLLDKHAFTKKSKDCNDDSSIAIDMCLEMLDHERSHIGLKLTRTTLEEQEQIYRDEEQVSTNGMKEIDGFLDADGTALEEEMATLDEQELEALRVEKANYERTCQDIKSHYKEVKAQRSLEKSQRQRDLISKRNEFQQQRKQTQDEKFSNLTQAKAYLMAFDTGVDLFKQYVDAHRNKNPDIVSKIKLNHQKLASLQEYIATDATNALKEFIWGSDDDIDH